MFEKFLLIKLFRTQFVRNDFFFSQKSTSLCHCKMIRMTTIKKKVQWSLSSIENLWLPGYSQSGRITTTNHIVERALTSTVVGCCSGNKNKKKLIRFDHAYFNIILLITRPLFRIILSWKIVFFLIWFSKFCSSFFFNPISLYTQKHKRLF